MNLNRIDPYADMQIMYSIICTFEAFISLNMANLIDKQGLTLYNPFLEK